MKRKTLSIIAAVAISSSLTGCTLFNSKLDPSPELEFNYAAVNGPATGLVRAFVLNGSTVLQFVDITQAQPKVYAADQTTPMPYQVIGQYAVLSGLHSTLRVIGNGATATVTATRASPLKMTAEKPVPDEPRSIGATAAVAAPTAAVAAPAPAASSVTPADLLQHEQRELVQLRKEVEDMKRQLASNTGAGAGGGIVPMGSSIKRAALIVPAGDVARAWNLAANRTLKDNVADMAQKAGYSVTWKASNPYMVTYAKTYQGTLQEVIGEIAQEVPALDFRLYPWKNRLEVVDARE